MKAVLISGSPRKNGNTEILSQTFGRECGDVENDKEGLATVDRFAENLIWACKETLLKR